MVLTVRKLHSAVKHAGFSPTTLLPGEDPAAFEKLREELTAELAPAGPLERDIVDCMVRLVWRRQNLATFRVADLARKRMSVIERERSGYDLSDIAAAQDSADAQGRQELGELYAFIEIGEAATLERLLAELGVEDRLDAMIDRCMKRLLLLRGFKSMAAAPASAPSLRIAGLPESGHTGPS
jgi:hypothetical protein